MRLNPYFFQDEKPSGNLRYLMDFAVSEFKKLGLRFDSLDFYVAGSQAGQAWKTRYDVARIRKSLIKDDLSPEEFTYLSLFFTSAQIQGSKSSREFILKNAHTSDLDMVILGNIKIPDTGKQMRGMLSYPQKSNFYWNGVMDLLVNTDILGPFFKIA